MENETEPNDWTTATLAQAAGLTTARIRQILIAGRDLRGRKLGRDWFVYDEEARAWLAAREERRKAKQPAPKP